MKVNDRDNSGGDNFFFYHGLVTVIDRDKFIRIVTVYDHDKFFHGYKP